MVDVVVAPDADAPQVAQNGTMLRRFGNWLRLVTEFDLLSGTGTPEGFIEAKQKRIYMDESGAAGAIMYVKRDADIGGDRTLGWIAV